MQMIERLRMAWRNTEFVKSGPRRVAIVSEWALRKVEERLIDGYYGRQGLDTKGPAFDQIDATNELRGYVPTDWRVRNLSSDLRHS